MERKSIYVAFSNQKGGVGKSVFATVITSCLHYGTSRNMLLVDCDYPQYSIKAMKERDMDAVIHSDRYKQILVSQYEKIQKKAYPVLTAQPGQAVDVADRFLAESQERFDMVVFDMPGTVNSDGVLKSLLSFDYVFCPIVSDRMVMQSSLAFATTLQDYIRINPKVSLKKIYLFWNKVARRENNELHLVYSRIIENLQLNILKTEIPETTRYKKEMSVHNSPTFRSTLFPPDQKMVKESRIDLLVDEICQVINLQDHE